MWGCAHSGEVISESQRGAVLAPLCIKESEPVWRTTRSDEIKNESRVVLCELG